MRDTGRPMAAWALSGEPAGYTWEAALADRKKWLDQQEFLEAIRSLDEVELRHLLNAMEAAVRGEEPLEAGLVKCKQAMDAHRAQKAAKAVVSAAA